MKSVFKLTSFTLFCAGLFVVKSSDAQSDRGVSVNLSAITLSGSIRDLKYESNGKIESLNAFTGTRSPRFRYTGPQELIFFRELDFVGEDGEPARAVVGTMRLPAAAGDFLAVFVELPGETERYQITPLPDDLRSFKPGMYRFLNMTPYQIAIQIGDEQEMIPKRGYKDIESRAEESSYQDTMIVSLPEQKGNAEVRPYRVFKGSLYFSSDLRIMYVMTPIPGGRPGRVKISSIRENVQARQ